MLLLIGSRQLGCLAIVRAHWRHGRSFKKACQRWSKSAQNLLTRGDVCPASQSAGKRGPPSALRNGRGGALAEEFSSVTRRFPWSVIAVEALSPMVFIHTRRIIIVPSHQYLLGLFPPFFESHRRLVSYIFVVAGRDSRSPGQRLCIVPFLASGHFDLGQEPLNLRSPSCR